MRTSRIIYISHRFVAVSNRTRIEILVLLWTWWITRIRPCLVLLAPALVTEYTIYKKVKSGCQVLKKTCIKFVFFYSLPKKKIFNEHLMSESRSSTQVWALCSETRALREADVSWFRHVASEKRACSLGMRCVTLVARDSCSIFASLAHRPVPPQRRGLWWPKWVKTASLSARDVLWY